jgi:hypothetical protein
MLLHSPGRDDSRSFVESLPAQVPRLLPVRRTSAATSAYSVQPSTPAEALGTRAHGPMSAGVQEVVPGGSVYGAGGVGGVAHGMLVKSKNSTRSGCAASRLVR